MEITSRSFVLVVVFLLCIETSYCRYYTREVKKSLQNPLRYGETDIVFVLDASGRVGGYNFGREVTFVRNLLNKINVYVDGAQVSLIRYDDDVDVLIHQIGCWPGSSKCELLPALSRVSYTGGSSNMGAALQKARELFESSRPGAKKVLVLLTDGHSDGNENPDHQATLLKATGVEIFTIGIGSYDYSELQSIASPPYSLHVYPYNNFNDFNGLVLQIRGVVECTPLQPYLNQIMQPTDGDFKYGDVFSFTCESGYQPADPNVPQTQQLQCVHDPGQSQGRWEGTRVACSRIQCGQLHAPAHGSIRCNASNWYQSECRFACSPGYILNGSQIRNCQNDKQWTGTEAFCEAITCAQLNPLPHAVAYPSTCTMSKTSYLDRCIFSCKPGYSSTNGQTTLVTTCGDPVPGSSDGTWTEPIDGFICEDTTPPRITCPGDITADNNPGLDSAEVTWAAPVATDTTGVTPVVLGSVTPPHRFTIGRHTLNYTAVDEAGLSSSCDFQVRIRDVEPPTLLTCPDGIIAFADRVINVYWEEPTFVDNADDDLMIFKTHENGTEFYWGTYIVEYRAEDDGGNTKTCEFTIDVVPHRCEYYRPPVNGATACDTWHYGQFCTVLCNHLYEFATSPAQLYVCGASGDWSTFPPGYSLPWPDCSERRDPNEVHKGLEAQYFVGDCHNESTQLSIKQQYLEILQGSIFGMMGACMEYNGNSACLVENVVVHSGGVNDTITTHKPITCARLNPLPNVVAYPSNCTMSKTSYLDSCIFSCKPGYSSTNGQTTLVTTCVAPSIPGSSNGAWTEPIDGFICEDTTPPRITCPGDITADNNPGLDSAEVTWAAPVATDTTGVTPVVLNSVTPPHRFTIGRHTLNYTAVDEAGLSSSCYFQVEIRDITDPECISCPEDINVFSSNREFAIQWDEPTWIDNSGNIADVFSSHIPGSLFYWGSPQFVYYIARDNAGNTGFCNFTVTVKQHACPYQAPPRNGALACDTWLGGQFCSVSCNRDFGFAREPESLYYCKQEEGGGRWSSLFPSFQEIIFPWPDCTRTSSPGVVGPFQVQYYTSDCAVDTEEIRQNFIEQAKMLNAFAVGFCMDEAECNIDNVHVSCGTSRGARTTHYFISVDFNLVVHAKESSSFNGSFVQAATAHIDIFVVGIETTIANGAFNISVGNHTISTIPGTFSTAGDTVLMCSQGSVLKDSDCLSCPAGTFSNGTSCTDCPPGFYQDKEAQISCLPCLNGTTTYHPRAVSAEECKEQCGDHTFFDETTNDCRNVSTTAAAEIGSHGCPPDTVPYSNSCYIILDESADYMTARKICESGGGYLVVVKDEGEHQFLIDHLNSTIDIWIGLDDIINEGTFVYNDGSPLGAFRKWATGEPNDAVGNNDCVHLWPLAGMTWADTICTKEKRFVCEFEK